MIHFERTSSSHGEFSMAISLPCATLSFSGFVHAGEAERDNFGFWINDSVLIALVMHTSPMQGDFR